MVELPMANADLNTNGVDDAVDIFLVASQDNNGNAVPDEVEPCLTPMFTLKPNAQVVRIADTLVLSASAL